MRSWRKRRGGCTSEVEGGGRVKGREKVTVLVMDEGGKIIQIIEMTPTRIRRIG